MLRKFSFLAALSVFLALPAAADSSLADYDRLAFGIGASYEWHSGRLAPAPAQSNEIAVNAFGAYSLTEHFTGVARVAYGAGNRTLRVAPGLHYNASLANEAFALGLTYDFYAGNFEPGYPNEWVVSAIYSRPVGKRLTLSVVESFGFDNHWNRVSVQATVPVFVGRAD